MDKPSAAPKQHPTRLGLAVAGGCVAAMMGVGPDEAEINFCKWLTKYVTRVPDACLPGISSDTLQIIAVAMIFGGVIWYLWPRIRSGYSRGLMLPGLLTAWFALSAVTGFAVYQHFWGESKTSDATKIADEQIEKVTAPYKAKVAELTEQIQRLTPQPTSPAISKTYLRADADVLIPALRQIHTIIKESLDDSSNRTGVFQNYSRHPFKQPADVQTIVPIKLQGLNGLLQYYKDLQIEIDRVIKDKNNSFYIDTLSEFQTAATPSNIFYENMVDYINTLNLMQSSAHAAANSLSIIASYDTKIVRGFVEQQGMRGAALQRINTLIEEIRKSARG